MCFFLNYLLNIDYHKGSNQILELFIKLVRNNYLIMITNKSFMHLKYLLDIILQVVLKTLRNKFKNLLELLLRV